MGFFVFAAGVTVGMSSDVASPIALHLARQADTAWHQIVLPWLVTGRAGLERSLVVVPTRGQAHLIKQRCMREGVPLLGVEFLTPGLARKKWLASGQAKAPALGRELLLLGLKSRIAQRLKPLKPGAPSWGYWRSLQSDPERALDDFDELLKAGFRASDFPRSELVEVFDDLTGWVESMGASLAPLQSEAAALKPLTDIEQRIGGRLLVLGLSAEAWGEFFNVIALIRRMGAVTVILPEPAFRGRGALDEKWIELWQSMLGVEAEIVEEMDPCESCVAVGELWTHESGSADRAEVIVGQTKTDEMVLVVKKIRSLLANGAENIGVVFPRADAAHLRLARLLTTQGVPFADLLETAGPPPIDVQVQLALVTFYERGARLDELLALWPLLRAIGLVNQTNAVARDVCERVFDETQSRALANNLARLQTRDRPEWREVARIVALLLPVWPIELTLRVALERFEQTCEKLGLELTSGWIALRSFAARSNEVYPLEVVLGTVKLFLPVKSAVTNPAGRGNFAPVTLTSRRRAEGLAWSHLILVESNAGLWPERRQGSGWLTDDDRTKLNQRSRFSLGVYTAEDRAMLERHGFASLAGDTREKVIFSAALFKEEEPELPLAPNAWLERVLWGQGKANGPGGLERAFAEMALTALDSSPTSAMENWRSIWLGRRDPRRPFDEWFLSADPAKIQPDHLTARLIESGLQDPAEFWFSSVLGITRMGWEPLVRVKAKVMGQLAHGLMASALRSTEVTPDGFGPMPSLEQSQSIMKQQLAQIRSQWPRDCYWDSFQAELANLGRELLMRAHEGEHGQFVATELRLPAGATLRVGDMRVPVTGRMDLVRSDQPQWDGANVEIFDFKTGGDAKLSADRMARSGDGLQLGIYLAAVQSLKIADGKVWMIKARADVAQPLGLEELPEALGQLERLRMFIETGKYGALTRDRSKYGIGGFVWPVACTPVPYSVLAAKFAATFGGMINKEGEDE